MSNKQYFYIVLSGALLLLSACATRTVPDSDNPKALTLSAAQPELAPLTLKTEVSGKIALLETMLACMERVGSLQPSELATEIDRLQSKSTLAHALPEKENSGYLIERFSLACLLGREAASDGESGRAQAILEELALAFEHEDERQLIRYMERSLGLQRSLRRHQSQLNRLRQQNTELQEKIEQLKVLERDLEVNNPYSGESDR